MKISRALQIDKRKIHIVAKNAMWLIYNNHVIISRVV